MIALFLASALVAPEPLSVPVRFDCEVSLVTPQGQIFAPVQVTISFVINDRSLSDIHVVDPGGILHPGGNMRMVEKPDAIVLEVVEFPPERPGVWQGIIKRNQYNLTLQSDGLLKAVEISLSQKPNKRTSRYGLVWNATHEPAGMSQSMSGQGIGNCAKMTGTE
jgi:hypothetical protein